MKYSKLLLVLFLFFTMVACDTNKSNNKANDTTIDSGDNTGGDNTGGDNTESDDTKTDNASSSVFGYSNILYMIVYDDNESENNIIYTLYKSADNGLTWSSVLKSNAFISISMINEQTFIANDGNGTTYRSTDNLTTFEKLNMNIPNFDSFTWNLTYFHSYFPNIINLVAIKDKMFLMYYSGDEGNTFQKVFEEPVASCTTLRPSFIDSNNITMSSKLLNICYLPYDFSNQLQPYHYYKSEDRGKTWSKIYTSAEYSSYSAIDDNTFLIMTKDGIYRSVDGWNNFTKLPFNLSSTKSHQIHYGGNKTVFLSTLTNDNRSIVYRSTDFGTNFEKVVLPIPEDRYKTIAPPMILGLFGSDTSRFTMITSLEDKQTQTRYNQLHISTDDGVSWDSMMYPTTMPYIHGYINIYLNQDDGIYRSVDVGKSFKKLSIDTSSFKYYYIYTHIGSRLFLTASTTDNKALLFYSDDMGDTFSQVFTKQSKNNFSTISIISQGMYYK